MFRNKNIGDFLRYFTDCSPANIPRELIVHGYSVLGDYKNNLSQR